MDGYRVAVVGAGSLVGQEIVSVLRHRAFPASSINLYTTEKPAVKRTAIAHQEYEIKEVTPEAYTGVTFVFLAADAEGGRHQAPLAVRKGATVIDTSSYYRTYSDIPLVAAQVNPEAAVRHPGIIASPNCITIPLVNALNPLHLVNPIKRITAATFQSVSGIGGAAVDELKAQTRQVLGGEPTNSHIFPHQIAFNLLPEIDAFMDDGYTREERVLAQEARRILGADDILISTTCVRVPVFRGSAIALHIEFAERLDMDDVGRILDTAPDIRVQDDTNVRLYPQPLGVLGMDQVFVGRLRQDLSHPNGLAMWLVADDVRAPALNAVRIAEELITRNAIKKTTVGGGT